jgi:hypothetical protein
LHQKSDFRVTAQAVICIVNIVLQSGYDHFHFAINAGKRVIEALIPHLNSLECEFILKAIKRLAENDEGLAEYSKSMLEGADQYLPDDLLSGAFEEMSSSVTPLSQGETFLI